jgi:hypothetical protein
MAKKKTKKPTPPKPTPPKAPTPPPVPPKPYKNSFAEVAFLAEGRFSSFDVDGNITLSLFNHPIKAVIASNVDTTMHAKFTDAYNYNPTAGDYFLLTGQVSSSSAIGEWSPASYPRGSRVKYLGEIYHAIAEVTGNAPPALISTAIDRNGNPYYNRTDNSAWALVGRDGTPGGPANVKAEPSIKVTNANHGENWQVVCLKDQSGIIFLDAVRTDAYNATSSLSLNTTYQIGQADGQPKFFPDGTTFTTDTSGPGYTASQNALANGDSFAGDRLKFVTIHTIPTQPATKATGGGNGIYYYSGPDNPLVRLNAGESLMSAPMSYSYLLLLESDPRRMVRGKTTPLNQYWMSDDQGNWAPVSYNGISKGNVYWYYDIPAIGTNKAWRAADGVVGRNVEPWQPTKIYYLDDHVVFNGEHYKALDAIQTGFYGKSPLLSNYWDKISPNGVSITGSANAIRGTKIYISPETKNENGIEVELPLFNARSFAGVVVDKVLKITTPMPPKKVVSFLVEGENETDYVSSSEMDVYSNTVYKANRPITFTLSNGGISAYKTIWDFGDGTTSTDTNPIHYYQVGSVAPMSFKVSVVLTATDGQIYKHSRTISLRRTDVSLLGIPIVAAPS